MQPKTLFSATAAAFTGCALSLMLSAVPAHAKAKSWTAERGVEPAHQPQVARTDFVFDVSGSGEGALNPAETRRLKAWFDALGLRYGDHVSLAGGSGLRGVRDSVSELVGSYGLLTDGEAPVTAGDPPSGSLRIVVSRSTASVEGCPSWRDRSQADFVGGLSDNYGCATQSNLAAMVADPQDLVQGRSTDSDLRTATGSRAIKTYREKAPTGSGNLQVMTAGSK